MPRGPWSGSQAAGEHSHHNSHQQSNDDSQDRASQNLKRRVPDQDLELLEAVDLRHAFRHHFDVVDHRVDDFGLPAGLAPDAHRVVHDDEREEERHREVKPGCAVLDGRHRAQGADGRAVGAWHAAAPDEALLPEFFIQPGVQQRLETLRDQPAERRSDGNRVVKKIFNKRHAFSCPARYPCSSI